jgi:hypothetical protein
MAEEEAQRYKVGKFILETKRVMRGTEWESDVAEAAEKKQEEQHGAAAAAVVKEVDSDDESVVEFDSEDEDECEDLFMGIWSEQLARKRRRDKAWRMAGDPL